MDKIEFELLNCEEKRFVGVKRRIGGKAADRPSLVRAMWAELEASGVLTELLALCPDEPRIAAISMDFTKTGYDYMLAAQTDRDVPSGMEELIVGRGEYAVIPCTGSAFESVASKWDELYRYWFSHNGFAHTGAPEIEYYPAGDRSAEDYHAEIHIPVKKLEPRASAPDPRKGLRTSQFVLIGLFIGILIGAATGKILPWALAFAALGFAVSAYVNKREAAKPKKASSVIEKDADGEDGGQAGGETDGEDKDK